MIRTRVARRYARALFDLAREQDKIEAIGEQLREVHELLTGNTELRSTLMAPVLPRKAKAQILEALLERVELDPLVANFLRVLLEARKLVLLDEILQAYGEFADEAAGRVRGEVVTALPLEPGELDALRSALSRSLNKEVLLSARQSPEILGGVVARVGNMVFDASLRTQLQRLRESLIKG